MRRLSFATSILVVTACATPPPPPARPAPPVVAVTPPVTAPDAGVAPAASLHADPLAGTLRLDDAPVALGRMRVDPRGVRGELPSTPRPLSPTSPIDLSPWGGDLRVVLAPPVGAGDALGAKRRLVLAARDMGEGHFRAVEGDDDAYWDGAPAFDPRSVFAELTGVRTALRERWKLAARATHYTFLFAAPVERPRGAFLVDRVPGALLLEVSAVDPWGTTLRVALAAALVQELLDLVRVEAEPDDEWFTYGLPRAYARELLRRFGTLSAKDVADDVSRTTNMLVESAAFVPPEQRALAGDRWGFELARALEAKGGLLELFDRLFRDAIAGAARFTSVEFLSRARAALGAPVSPPSAKDVPRGARSICFDVTPERRARFGFPFAWESSRGAGRIEGAAPGAPVADGERLVKLDVVAGVMKVVLMRGGEPVNVTVSGTPLPPITTPKVVARTDVDEAKCREAP